MEKNKIKTFVSKIGVYIKHALIYLIVLTSLVVGFSIGFNYNRILEFSNTEAKKPEFVRKSEVSLALDENNHILLINKQNGKYFIIQDSVGRGIFGFYAKDIWKEHSPSAVVTEK